VNDDLMWAAGDIEWHKDAPPIPAKRERPTDEAHADSKKRGLLTVTDESRAAVTDKSWDGSASRFTDEQYKRSCLIDRGGDAPVKERYSLPIREPDGTINVNALGAALAALNGARGGLKNLSDAQRAAAKAKLADAYKAAGKPVPDGLTGTRDLPTAVRPGEREERMVTLDEAEVRDEGTDGLRFEGHAAVFDSPSLDLGGFIEYVKRGAFRKVLDTQPDVRFLYNHNKDAVLARTKSGTMQLREDTKGLQVDARWAPTSLARDLKVLVDRRDLDAMSFGFNVGAGNDSWRDENGQAIRDIHNFARLADVSLVTFEAYPDTAGVVLRSHVLGVEVRDDSGAILEDHLQELAHDIYLGKVEASAEERAALDKLFADTALISPWEAERVAHLLSENPAVIPGKALAVNLEEVREGAPTPAFRLAARKRRLALIAPPEQRAALMAPIPTQGEPDSDAEPPSSDDLQGAAQKIDALADDIDTALAKVGIGNPDPDDAPLAQGPFSDSDYSAALKAVQDAVEAIEDELEAVGLEDPDADDDAQTSPATAGTQQ
jgi:HK97 family phage prohead protease